MAQIINQESFGGNLGRNLGQTLGQGLSSGLQQLANQKLERMHKKSIQHDLRSAFPEIPEEAIAFIANKPAKEQLQILEMLGQQRQQNQEQQAIAQQQEQASGLQQLQQPQESIQPQDSSIPDDHYTPEVIQQLQEQLSSPEAAQQFPPEELQRARNNLLAMQEKLSSNPVGVNPFSQEQTRPNPVEQAVEQAVQKPVEKVVSKAIEKPVEQAVKKVGLKLSDLAKPTEKEDRARIKEERIAQHQQEQAAKKEQAAINKESQKYYDRVLDTEKAAKEADDRLNKMERLVKKGSLPNSALYGALKNIEDHVSPAAGAAAGAAIGGIFGGIGAAPGAVLGGALGALISPITTALRTGHKLIASDTEEFEKLSNQFISGAKAVFGNRITDQDLKAYMAQIPTLSNTDAGKLKIIEDMKIANKADKIRAKALKDIIKENGGNRPANLQLLVEERIAGQLDKLSKEFVEA